MKNLLAVLNFCLILLILGGSANFFIIFFNIVTIVTAKFMLPFK